MLHNYYDSCQTYDNTAQAKITTHHVNRYIPTSPYRLMPTVAFSDTEVSHDQKRNIKEQVRPISDTLSFVSNEFAHEVSRAGDTS